jgi:hypothetical protein
MKTETTNRFKGNWVKSVAALLMVTSALGSVAQALASGSEIRIAGTYKVEEGYYDDVAYYGDSCYTKEAIQAQADSLIESICEIPARQTNAKISRFLTQEGLESEKEAFVAYVNKDIRGGISPDAGCWRYENARYAYMGFRCEALIRNNSAQIEILKSETPESPRKDSAGNDLCARLLKQTVAQPETIKAEIKYTGGGPFGPGNTCKVSYLKAVKI